MAFRVELTVRAARDLRHIYRYINAVDSKAATAWFNELESAILSLSKNLARCPIIPERHDLRHLLHGSRRNTYRVIFEIDEPRGIVFVLHIRHGAQEPLVGGP